MEEALRCRAVGVAMGEIRARGIDQIATRRLSLAAAVGGTLGILLRATPHDEPSAAATRWIIGAAPSSLSFSQRARGIGPPRLTVRLVRSRRGRLGAWIVEWNSVEQRFELAMHSELMAKAASRPTASRSSGITQINAHKTSQPLVVFGKRGTVTFLVAVNAAAERTGVRNGLALAQARAMHPALIAVPEDQAADARVLDALADWCQRYTPLIAVDGSDGILLDISGCAHLFGREQKLRDDLLARVQGFGFSARTAIASTIGAAWAAARFASMAITPAGRERELSRAAAACRTATGAQNSGRPGAPRLETHRRPPRFASRPPRGPFRDRSHPQARPRARPGR